MDPNSGKTKRSMRRAIAVWCLWFWILVLLTLPALLFTSYFIDRSENYVAVGGNFFAILRNGRIEMGSDLDTSSADIRPAVVNPRLIIAPKVIRSGNVTVPGLELHFCALAGGDLVWSLGLSLWYPIVASAVITAVLFHRLRRRPARPAVPQATAC